MTKEEVNEIFYKKGDEFNCPICNDLILVFNQDVYRNEKVDVSKITCVNQVFVNGDILKCKRCFYSFYNEFINKG